MSERERVARAKNWTLTNRMMDERGMRVGLMDGGSSECDLSSDILERETLSSSSEEEVLLLLSLKWKEEEGKRKGLKQHKSAISCLIQSSNSCPI